MLVFVCRVLLYVLLTVVGAGAASPEQMHQQNRLEMVQQYDPRVFILKIVVVSLVLIGTVTMIVYTEVQGAQCDEQLSLWLVVYAFRTFLLVLMLLRFVCKTLMPKPVSPYIHKERAMIVFTEVHRGALADRVCLPYVFIGGHAFTWSGDTYS